MTYIFAIILKMSVGVYYLTLRGGGGVRLTNSSVTRINSPVAPFNILFYLQFLCLPSYFKQLCYGVHEPLEVMVAHLLNFPVMVPDPRIQLVHEEAMFVTVVHRAEKQKF